MACKARANFVRFMISTKFYLDTRYVKRDGYPLKLRISVKREASFISLDLSLPADQWDPVRLVIKKNCSNCKKLNEYIIRRKAQIDDCIRNLILDGALVGASARNVRDAVLNKLYPVSSSGSFVSNYNNFVQGHANKRTRQNYESTLALILQFDDCADKKDFKDINRKWLDEFYSWMLLKKKLCENTANLHRRNIRASFNDAIDHEVTTLYPFRGIKIKNQPTKKRNLCPEDLRSIFFAEVTASQKKYVDAFLLIFLLIGINSVDLLGLKKEDLKDGRITYFRAKTKKLYDIAVLPEALEIINKYPGKNKLLSFDENCSSYVNFSRTLNRNLSNIHSGLSAYYARHSWATIAAYLDIPKETIAAALGHGQNTVTDVYINFDLKKVDEANRRVVDFVLYGKRS